MSYCNNEFSARAIELQEVIYRLVCYFRLVDEIKSISDSVSALKAQLQQAEESLCGLLKARGDLEREIIVKRKTLQIDRDRCQKIRSHYPSTVALTGY
jgi:tektin-4